MPAPKYITRTLTTTVVRALCVNKLTERSEIHEFHLEGGPFNNDRAIIKACQQVAPHDLKVVNIKSHNTQRRRVGITEELFLSLAKELPIETNQKGDNNNAI